jgi:hypothetical protein
LLKNKILEVSVVQGAELVRLKNRTGAEPDRQRGATNRDVIEPVNMRSGYFFKK